MNEKTKDSLPKGYAEYWYLSYNPGVAQAVEKGHFESGEEHYLIYGHKEKRKYKKPLINPYFFIKINNVLKRNKIHLSGKNNKIHYDSASLFNVSIEVNGNNNNIKIKGGTKLNDCKIHINGDNHTLFIGYYCTFNSTLFGFEDNGCSIIINDGTTLFGNGVFAAVEPNSRIEVGEDCMFSIYNDVRTSDSHSILDIHTNKRINHAKNVQIGNHVWVGAYAKILKGVIVADNCTIAMSSIVTKSFDENNCIIGGNPAKVISKGKNWSRERMYT